MLSRSSRVLRALPGLSRLPRAGIVTHFRESNVAHPLKAKPEAPNEPALGDHIGLQQNHIWSVDEIADIRGNIYKHSPQTFSDKVMNKLMSTLYKTINFVTGYKEKNPSPSSIEWRLIVLESVAGVPGFVAAAIRHFRSLRTMKRDHGWIMTLLEEAENERMHLLVCMTMFKASFVTRFMVLAAQVTMTPFLLGVYLVHPKACHRFVGYLEETAVYTYNNIVTHIETPGTELNKAWKDLDSPQIAIGYWKLPKDAKFVDTLKCMLADEANHRDTNHTFAMMETDDPNPFITKHKNDAAKAWRLENDGKTAWESKDIAI